MPFKTILSVTGATTIDDDLRVATDLCRQVGAHLSALVIARAPTGRYATHSPGWLEQRSERSYGSFQRSFPIPDVVDANKIEASFAKGLLTITLPKSAEAQKNEKKIAVKSA